MLGGCLWAHLDLNQGPHPYQGCALTNLSYGPVPINITRPRVPAGRPTWCHGTGAIGT